MGLSTEVGLGISTFAAQPEPAAFLRHSARYAVARLGLTALDVVLLPFYARSLSPADFGRVSVATSLFAILAIVYTLGFEGALQPLFFRNPAGSLKQRSVVTGCLTAMAVGGLICALALTARGPEALGALLSGVDDTFFRLVVWAAFFNIFLNAWLQLLQLRQHSNTYLWIAVATAVLRVAATIVAISVLHRGALGWAEAYVVSGAVAALVAISALMREATLFAPRTLFREALPFAVPLFLHQLAGWMSQSAGRLVLNQLTTLEAVGRYQVALTVGQGLGLVTLAVNFAYAPAFMAAASHSPADAGRRFGEFASHYLIALSCVAVLGIVFREHVVWALASSRFLSSAGLVPVVLISAVLQGCYYILVNPIFFSNATVRYLPAITVAGAIVSLGGTYLLVPKIGILGAALASLIAMGSVVMLAYPLSQRSVPMVYDRARLGKAALIGLVTVAASIAGTTAGLPRLPLAMGLCLLFLIAVIRFDVVRPSAYGNMLAAAFPRGVRAP